jgi:hypothetical protein
MRCAGTKTELVAIMVPGWGNAPNPGNTCANPDGGVTQLKTKLIRMNKDVNLRIVAYWPMRYVINSHSS